jgi:hypothetical protein
MFQQRKNALAMQLAGIDLVFWLLLLYPASTAETGLLRWHPHMHWVDKLVYYASMAVGPALAGFLMGVRFGGRKVFDICNECGGKFDEDTMHWGLNDRRDEKDRVIYWRCQTCNKRYDEWNEWRKTQENSFSYRNEEERKWARKSWESDSGYLLEDVFWQGPNGKGFPDQPVEQ